MNDLIITFIVMLVACFFCYKIGKKYGNNKTYKHFDHRFLSEVKALAYKKKESDLANAIDLLREARNSGIRDLKIVSSSKINNTECYLLSQRFNYSYTEIRRNFQEVL